MDIVSTIVVLYNFQKWINRINLSCHVFIELCFVTDAQCKIHTGLYIVLCTHTLTHSVSTQSSMLIRDSNTNIFVRFLCIKSKIITFFHKTLETLIFHSYCDADGAGYRNRTALFILTAGVCVLCV